MKKYLILVVVLVTAISVTACGSKETEKEQQPQEIAQQDSQEVSEDNEETYSKDTENEEDNTSDSQDEYNENIENEGKESATAEDSAYRIPDFTSQDFEGNEVTNKYFADNKLTVVNIWTTT